MVVNRNDPCPCGSGKKYKKCCGLKEAKAHSKELQKSRNFFNANVGTSGNPVTSLVQRMIKVIESEDQIVPPDYIPESKASTEEAENPELELPKSLKPLS